MVATNEGFIVSEPPDYGVDLRVEGAGERVNGEKSRIFNNGKIIDIQVKSTIESSVTFKNDRLRYNLEAKNYNDLIDRKVNSAIPLILCVVILPDERDSWLDLTEDQLILKKSAYWFIPDKIVSTSNTSSLIIDILVSNKLEVTTISQIYNDYYA